MSFSQLIQEKVSGNLALKHFAEHIKQTTNFVNRLLESIEKVSD